MARRKKRKSKRKKKRLTKNSPQYWIKECKWWMRNYGKDADWLARKVLFYAPTSVLWKLASRKDEIGKASRIVLQWEIKGKQSQKPSLDLSRIF